MKKKLSIVALLIAAMLDKIPKHIELPGEFVCKECGEKFFSRRHNRTTFCSANCFKRYKEKKI